jgi:vacuolar protein sorting-associated protein 54
MIVGLRGTIVTQVSCNTWSQGQDLTADKQAKTFLQTFHQTRLSQAAKLVEDELWNPSDVPGDMQHIVDVLVDCAMRDPPELSSKPTTTSSSEASSSSEANAAVNGTSTPASSKHLKVEERTYFVVGATLQTLVLLVDYVRLVLALETLTTDTMARCIEFLKAFNSRTCQVVLGAGAMRSAGLKNITAKHLGACVAIV